ncbi:hypothetical protein ACPZ8L_20360 [Klebsiella variicola subsp. variicola]
MTETSSPPRSPTIRCHNGSGSCGICLALICLHKLSTIAIAEKTIKANR